MPDAFEWPKPEEPADEILLRNVRERGCHILGVSGDERAPPFAFSIGLFVNYGQAEIILFGLESKLRPPSSTSFTRMRLRARNTPTAMSPPTFWSARRCVSSGCRCLLYQNYLGTALWFYRKSPRPVPCLQLVWPDRDGRFPWETGFDAGLKRDQPLLKSIS
jgi:uncharacterized protein DUF4262